jgi:hypothetical protein
VELGVAVIVNVTSEPKQAFETLAVIPLTVGLSTFVPSAVWFICVVSPPFVIEVKSKEVLSSTS